MKSKLEKSNAAHRRLMKKHKWHSVECQYHRLCSYEQLRLNRVLTKEEKKVIYNNAIDRSKKIKKGIDI